MRCEPQMYVLAHLLFAESGINSDFHLIVKRLQQCPQQANSVHLLEFPSQKEKKRTWYSQVCALRHTFTVMIFTYHGANMVM